MSEGERLSFESGWPCGGCCHLPLWLSLLPQASLLCRFAWCCQERVSTNRSRGMHGSPGLWAKPCRLLLDRVGVFVLQKVILHNTEAEFPFFNRSSQALHTFKTISFHYGVSKESFYLVLCASYCLIGPEEEFSALRLRKQINISLFCRWMWTGAGHSPPSWQNAKGTLGATKTQHTVPFGFLKVVFLNVAIHWNYLPPPPPRFWSNGSEV